MRRYHTCMLWSAIVVLAGGFNNFAYSSLVISPSVKIISHTIETRTHTIGGGGATPFILGPSMINGLNIFGNTVNNALDTGVQNAHDAAQNFRGTGQGIAVANANSVIDTATSTLSGNLLSIAQFNATPDLGNGLGQSDTTVRVVFKPEVDIDYTLDASLTVVIGSLAGNDVFSIRRTDQIGNPIVHLINNALTNDIVGASGTFLAGAEYTLLADLSNFESGGSAQSPGASETTALFNLEFESGTVFGLGGDLDNDGFVGISDLNTVLSNWNQNVPPADPASDPSGDGFVGIEDLNLVLSQWNASVPPGRGLAVPEPNSICVLLCLVAGLMKQGQRQHPVDL